MSVELWDVFDENGIPTGKTALRGRSVLSPGEYHLVVHIWVISKSGLFLIQRRADDKKLMPGEWAATGGAAVAGEERKTFSANNFSGIRAFFCRRVIIFKSIASILSPSGFAKVIIYQLSH